MLLFELWQAVDDRLENETPLVSVHVTFQIVYLLSGIRQVALDGLGIRFLAQLNRRDKFANVIDLLLTPPVLATGDSFEHVGAAHPQFHSNSPPSCLTERGC